MIHFLKTALPGAVMCCAVVSAQVQPATAEGTFTVVQAPENLNAVGIAAHMGPNIRPMDPVYVPGSVAYDLDLSRLPDPDPRRCLASELQWLVGESAEAAFAVSQALNSEYPPYLTSFRILQTNVQNVVSQDIVPWRTHIRFDIDDGVVSVGCEAAAGGIIDLGQVGNQADVP